MFNFFHQFIDTVLFLGERRGGDYFWGNLWTRENEGEEAVFKKRRHSVQVSAIVVSHRGGGRGAKGMGAKRGRVLISCG